MKPYIKCSLCAIVLLTVIVAFCLIFRQVVLGPTYYYARVQSVAGQNITLDVTGWYYYGLGPHSRITVPNEMNLKQGDKVTVWDQQSCKVVERNFADMPVACIPKDTIYAYRESDFYSTELYSFNPLEEDPYR